MEDNKLSGVMQPGSNALVSIVMCTYNGEQFIDEQVLSIVEQTYRPLEFIIVDDCSTDGTYNKLLLWQQKHDFIQVHRNPVNLGYNKNFEQSIQLARGAFIALSDQDDIWLKEKIAKQVQCFNDPQTVLVHNKSVRFQNNQFRYDLAKLQHHFSGNDTRKLFMFNQAMGHDMMFRATLVNQIIPIPEGMSYDWWITVNATTLGNIYSLNEFLVHHRIHQTNNFFSNTSSSKKKELDLLQTLQLFDTIQNLKQEARNFLQEFIELLKQHERKKGLDHKLFWFLFKNRRIIFSQKKRAIPELNYIKNAFKYARYNFKGKGISI